MHTPKLILALQFCPHDIREALGLLNLIVDIHHDNFSAPASYGSPLRSDVDFALCARRGCKEEDIQALKVIAQSVFFNVLVIEGKRFGEGWPLGCNDLWSESMMRLSLAKKNGKTDAEAVLTFEPDCVPLRYDWIDALKTAWAKASAEGFLCMGHVDYLKDSSPHINGNAIFNIDITKTHPALNSAPADQGWDAAHRVLLMSVGRDDDSINQVYGQGAPDYMTFASIRKNGTVPALHHGIKQSKGVEMARKMIEDGLFGRKPEAGPFVFTPEGTRRDFLLDLSSKTGLPLDGPIEVKCAIFIRSYAKDIPWLGYCLKSIEKFATGFGSVVVVHPRQEKHDFYWVWNRFPQFQFVESDPLTQDGYIAQQIDKLNADKYTDADYILFLDSDCFAFTPFKPEDFFKDNLPMMIHRSWDGLGDAESWKAPTKLALGFEPLRETMCRMPIIHDRRALKGVRDLMEHNTGAKADLTIASFGKFSEFNAIGNFVLRFMPLAYSFVSTEEEEIFPNVISQAWSWGGLTDGQKEVMDNILNATAPAEVIKPIEPPDLNQSAWKAQDALLAINSSEAFQEEVIKPLTQEITGSVPVHSIFLEDQFTPLFNPGAPADLNQITQSAQGAQPTINYSKGFMAQAPIPITQEPATAPEPVSGPIDPVPAPEAPQEPPDEHLGTIKELDRPIKKRKGPKA